MITLQKMNNSLKLENFSFKDKKDLYDFLLNLEIDNLRKNVFLLTEKDSTSILIEDNCFQLINAIATGYFSKLASKLIEGKSIFDNDMKENYCFCLQIHDNFRSAYSIANEIKEDEYRDRIGNN